MNARSVKTSDKLKTVLGFLRSRASDGATSREIMEYCNTVAPGTVVSELRKNGYDVSCKFERITDGNAKVFRYRLIG